MTLAKASRLRGLTHTLMMPSQIFPSLPEHDTVIEKDQKKSLHFYLMFKYQEWGVGRGGS